MRRLANIAVLVAAISRTYAAFGDDDPGGWWYADCSSYPWDCQTACEDYNQCLSSAIDPSLCEAELAWLEACPSTIGPPSTPPPIIVLPPSCPVGQHRNEDGQCEADHVCGDDEIGGGPVECETCTDGKVPNDDKTECVEPVEPVDPWREKCDQQGGEWVKDTTHWFESGWCLYDGEVFGTCWVHSSDLPPRQVPPAPGLLRCRMFLK